MASRLFVQPGSLATGAQVIAGADHHYLFRVLRLRAGDAVVLFDGAGHEAEAVVQSVAADQAVLAVSEMREVREPPGCRLTVAPALIKGERMDLCIQKLVELGVSAIAPVMTARTVVRLSGERAHKRQQRFVEVARDAARQSRRASVPVIEEIRELGPFVAAAGHHELKLVLWEGERGRSLRDCLPSTAPASVCVLIGPEGGLADAEVEQAAQAGFMTVGLGPYILRAETAAIAAAAMLGFVFGRLGG